MVSLTELLVIVGIIVAIVKARAIFSLGVGKSLGVEAMTPDDEVAIGREWLLALGDREPIAIERHERVRAILTALQRARHMRFPRYLAFRLDSPAINAMALPGGHVLVTRGLMELPDLEDDELAGILAHEIGHIELGHSREALIRTNRARALELVLSIAGRRPGMTLGAVKSLAELGISRESELEADAFAVELLAHTPYRAEGLVSFLARAQRGGHLPGWLTFLSTHPAVEERIGRLREHGLAQVRGAPRP